MTLGIKAWNENQEQWVYTHITTIPARPEITYCPTHITIISAGYKTISNVSKMSSWAESVRYEQVIFVFYVDVDFRACRRDAAIALPIDIVLSTGSLPTLFGCGCWILFFSFLLLSCPSRFLPSPLAHLPSPPASTSSSSSSSSCATWQGLGAAARPCEQPVTGNVFSSDGNGTPSNLERRSVQQESPVARNVSPLGGNAWVRWGREGWFLVGLP